MLALVHGLDRIAPRRLHLGRIGESLLRHRGQSALKPRADLRWMLREIDVSTELARQDRTSVRLPERGLAREHEGNDRGHREAIDCGLLLLAEQLLWCGERRGA